jgi:hypothetical protein
MEDKKLYFPYRMNTTKILKEILNRLDSYLSNTHFLIMLKTISRLIGLEI